MSACAGWSRSVGKIKIPYYVVVKGRGYWRPHPRMRVSGFQIIRCGPDGPEAWKIAEDWNLKWQAVRKGDAPPLIDLSNLNRDEAEAVRRYPPGSIGAAFQTYIRTPEWLARALSTRIKVWWPAWYRIREMWGDVNPNTITFDQMSRWRAALEKQHGRGVAHKTFRVWRSFWKIMEGMRVAVVTDPSRGIRNRGPNPRYQRWSEGEAVRLVKGAWRKGFRGLACIIAVAWDSQFSPVDIRSLRARHRAVIDGRLIFDRQAEGRAKTGRAAIGTLSPRTERLVRAYIDSLTLELLPDAILFRNRSNSPYRDDTLGDDFRAVRELVFPGDRRRLMDMRRSGVVEAIAGDAGPLGLAAKLANSIQQSNELHRTYAPVDIEAVRNTDYARLKGRRKMRAENRSGAKVSTGHPAGVSTATRDRS
jgi:hypothetical protein